MSLMIEKILLVAIGAGLILFGGRIIRFYVRRYPTQKGKGIASNSWAVRVFGVGLVIVGLILPSSNPWPWRTLMSRDENLIMLLEKGRIAEGRVAKVFYQRGAPEGWRMDYEFDANDASANSARTYAGSAQGPKRYYAYLKAGESITIIYCPGDPRITCEIRQLLNDPTYRFVLKKTAKLHLLDRFRDEYEVEDISFKEWCKQKWQK